MVTCRACLKAAETLKSEGTTALDAVEAAIRELESDENLNAGTLQFTDGLPYSPISRLWV
jgi:isoaspartyl peptidase/L-asparaginase-like protein (Ntn-hydrolase superfamily)